MATAAASDIDAGQALTYSLGSGAPTNAAIGATSGVFTWPTSSEDAGTARTITIVASDNGTPMLSDSTTFTVTVAAPPLIQGVELSGTNVVLTWAAISGKSYRVEYKDTFAAPVWSNLPPDVTASGSTASKVDSLDGPQRFYRIRSLD